MSDILHATKGAIFNKGEAWKLLDITPLYPTPSFGATMDMFRLLNAGAVVLFLDPYDSWSRQVEGWYRVLGPTREGYICVNVVFGNSEETVGQLQ